MAATQTVPHLLLDSKSPALVVPRHGVLTLFGFGIRVYVERGHLTIEDGIGADRRKARLPRVGHGLRRLVVIGSDGFVSLAALRWLADQDACFVMLERDGSVLATTGPVSPSDARLRRAQVLAHNSGAALHIVRELIEQKLGAQEKLASNSLGCVEAATSISRLRQAVKTARSMEAIRSLESRAAHIYWGAWRAVSINFPKSDIRRMPVHWQSFGTRVSPLTGSPRLAANPINAMLNYLYALLEAETRLAIAALGLDPGLGFLHVDAQSRDSLACDVMEPIRPHVDAHVFTWISREVLRREWFFEQRDGNCRLMSGFASRLSEYAPTLACAVAPIAERVAHFLWLTVRKPPSSRQLPTRLTQRRRREARDGATEVSAVAPPKPESFCRDCGAVTGQGRTYCLSCSISLNTAGLIKAAEKGRVAAQSDQAQNRRSETQRRHTTARAGWKTSDLPAWLSDKIYHHEIKPRLKTVTLSVMASKLGISIPYAVDIRSGRRVPHRRHWQTLAQLVCVADPGMVYRF